MQTFITESPGSVLKPIQVKDKSELTELFVDENRKLTKITVKCTRFKDELIAWFGYDLFSYQEAKDFSESHGYSQYAATQWLNMLWKNDQLRKFYRGKYTLTPKLNGGKYFGVHYQFYDQLQPTGLD